MMNIVVVLIIGSMDNLHATSWSKIDDNLFHQAFGFYGIAFIGSIIACYISQKIDIFLYLRIKTLTKGKYLGLRNFLSSSVSLFIDTFIAPLPLYRLVWSACEAGVALRASKCSAPIRRR